MISLAGRESMLAGSSSLVVAAMARACYVCGGRLRAGGVEGAVMFGGATRSST